MVPFTFPCMCMVNLSLKIACRDVYKMESPRAKYTLKMTLFYILCNNLGHGTAWYQQTYIKLFKHDYIWFFYIIWERIFIFPFLMLWYFCYLGWLLFDPLKPQLLVSLRAFLFYYALLYLNFDPIHPLPLSFFHFSFYLCKLIHFTFIYACLSLHCRLERNVRIPLCLKLSLDSSNFPYAVALFCLTYFHILLSIKINTIFCDS